MPHDSSPPFARPGPPSTRDDTRLRFEEVVRLHGPPLRRFLQRYTGDTHAAEDLAQDTFVRAYLRLDDFDEARPFAPWLFTIAANLGRDHLRRRSRREGREDALAPELACPRPGPAAELDRGEQKSRLENAIARLPDGLREPLLLHYEVGWPVAEIARHLGLEPGAVKVRLHRARHQLHLWINPPSSFHE